MPERLGPEGYFPESEDVPDPGFRLQVELRQERLERGRQLMGAERIAESGFSDNDVPRLSEY
jgi:hypothetical protein